ncbi:MAG: protein kinase [bacterium]
MSESSDSPAKPPGPTQVDRGALPFDATVPGQTTSGSPEDPALDATMASQPAFVLDPAVDATVASRPGGSVTPAEPEDLSGRTVQHFRVEALIGAGGMGSVYRAHDLSLDRPVALKVIAPHIAQDPTQRERFIREARSQARLSHAHVVPIYYIGEHDGLLFFAMELVEGEALSALLDRGEHLPWARALEIIIAVSKALQLAHERGIVHRDIKPSNLLLDGSGAVKVADFGLAKPVESESDSQLTQQGTVLGSPLYMSPEQGQGEPVDHRSDIYSLGAAFYHLLVGRPPFQAKTPVGVIAKHMSQPVPPVAKAMPGIPDGVERIVERMLAKDPADRFQDYGALLRALEAARPQSAARAGLMPRAMALAIDWTLAGIAVSILGILGLLLYAAYTIVGWWRNGQTVGKWLFKLRVRTVENGPLTLWRAAARFAAQNWGHVVMFAIAVALRATFGAWNLNVTDEVYDKSPAAVVLFIVLLSLTYLLYFVSLMWAGVRRHNRTWHDFVAGTMVVYHLPSGEEKKGS